MGYFSDDEARSRQIILEHYESPDNKVEEPLSDYLSFNNKSSSCIDNLTVYLKINDVGKIVDAKFSGIGCAISTSSTDIMCNLIKDKDTKSATKIIDEYFKMVDGLEYDESVLEILTIFKNISKQLNRIKCAKVGVVAIKELIAN